MKVDMKFAELQTPLFLEGVNHGNKLGSKHTLDMHWDTESDKLVVKFKNETAVIPMANVASMTPKDGMLFTQAVLATKVMTTPSPIKAMAGRPKRVSAQVSTPTSHVFEGTEDKSIE